LERFVRASSKTCVRAHAHGDTWHMNGGAVCLAIPLTHDDERGSDPEEAKFGGELPEEVTGQWLDPE